MGFNPRIEWRGRFRRRVATLEKTEAFGRRYATISQYRNRHSGLKLAATITAWLGDERFASRTNPRDRFLRRATARSLANPIVHARRVDVPRSS